MKVTMIIGEPAVGKSTLVRACMSGFANQYRHPKFVPHHYLLTPELAVLGNYLLEDAFPGTDKMSMACQPHVIKWLATCGYKAVLFEGDRLCNISMIDSLYSIFDLQIIVLLTSEKELDVRRKVCRTNQTEKFWKSRKTKVQNIIDTCMNYVSIRMFGHSTPEDTQQIREYILTNRL